MLSLETQALRTIRLEKMLAAGETVLVALSGGPDSVALLSALLALRSRLGIEVTAGHVNHGLRGRESDADQEFVEDLCRRLGVALAVRRLSGPDPDRKGNLEQRLRRDRYRALFEMAGETSAAVATGHTLDDQAETFLMKAARGAGLSGLGGVYPVRRNRFGSQGRRVTVKVVRPLIGCRRTEVEAYLALRGQAWREDATNRDLALDRNWVRRELLPLMAERLNPKTVENIGRNAAVLREIETWLKRRARAALRVCLSATEEGSGLSVEGLSRLPKALAQETVRLAILKVRGSLTRVGQRNVSDVLGLLGSTSGGSVDLPDGWRVVREYGLLRFVQGIPTDFEMELSVPGEIFVYQAGKRLRAERVSAWVEKPDAPETGVCLRLKADRLTVRNRRPGDRLMLDGRWVKLKDLFQRRRVPVGKRNQALVLEGGQGVVWVEGVGIDDRCRPVPESPDLVRIVLAGETFQGRDGSKKLPE